ncbi:hypothetical protein [Kitasatospora sp. CB01950]|uniref:hypothetical protein n=1 Tax=Kitasatospora sp. CB01950 TaxID=1703930 RepID=UPI0009389B98|nr:hypothetical protein [Kitasatospora sp. CB01950]OKJ00034.1 hypothetical protein AMK19_30230 [Kitasatospora sp. CB01950]
MSTESTGAAEPGADAAVPSEPPTTAPPVAPVPVPADVPADAPADAFPVSPAFPEAPSDSPEAFGQVELLAGGEEQEPARKKRKFGATALFLTAVVAGPVIGGVVGYGIQASRPATPLPKLAAPKLHYSAERIDAKALAASGPQPLNIDGDLRDLLIKRPDNTTAETDGDGDGWLTAADIAETYGDSSWEINDLLANGFRRAAQVSWSSNDVKYRVNLIQYMPENVNRAPGSMLPRHSNVDLSKIPGNEDSLVMVANKPEKYARSSQQYYWAGAMARKGTLLMSIEVFSKNNQVDRSQLEDIAKRQWERIA